jgi:hypothetical protein
MVLVALVRAKLLGIKILSLDVRVALGPAHSDSIGRTLNGKSQLAAASARSLEKRADIAQAMRLLEEGSKSLGEVKGIAKAPRPSGSGQA